MPSFPSTLLPLLLEAFDLPAVSTANLQLVTARLLYRLGAKLDLPPPKI